VSPPASAPSASTPALPVDDSDELSGAGAATGSAGARTGEGILERIEWADVVRIAVVGLAALGAWVAEATGTPGWAVGAIGAVVLAVGCWSLLVEAAGDLRERRMSMELSMLLAIVAAAGIVCTLGALGLGAWVWWHLDGPETRWQLFGAYATGSVAVVGVTCLALSALVSLTDWGRTRRKHKARHRD